MLPTVRDDLRGYPYYTTLQADLACLPKELVDEFVHAVCTHFAHKDGCSVTNNLGLEAPRVGAIHYLTGCVGGEGISFVTCPECGHTVPRKDWLA